MILNDIISVLKKSGSIIILPHISVDGDGLGSSLALGIALERANINVKIYIEEDIPCIYDFLPGKHLIEVYQNQVEKVDTVVALDTGDLGRLGQRVNFLNGTKTTINIDHHTTNSKFASLNFVQIKASSVGEIIYKMLKMMGTEIDESISTCLYVAIATDTGGFRFGNTTSLTHQITADLINNGVNVADISQKIFDTMSFGKVKLMGAAIGTLKIEEEGNIALITITDEMMKATGAKEEDCDGIVNIGRNVRGVEVAIMLRQQENGEVKINLRSNVKVDVSEIAGHYSGGGHKRAAGCIVKGEFVEVRQKLLEDIKRSLQAVNS